MDDAPIYTAADVAEMLAEERAAVVRWLQSREASWRLRSSGQPLHEAGRAIQGGAHRAPGQAQERTTAAEPSCGRPTSGDRVACAA